MSYLVGVSLSVFMVFTHGDLDQRILEKSNQIALHPYDYELYVERGDLYLAHEEYLNAKADFTFCIDHDFSNIRVLLGLSKSHFYLNSLDSAQVYVDKTLALEAGHLPALKLKGSILSQQERRCEAAVILDQLISIATLPSPELVLAASNEWMACDTDGHREQAIRILKEGIYRLGPIRVLQKRLVSVYRELARYDEAIEVQNIIIDQDGFKIRSYFERAQILIQMEETDKAIEDLMTAILLIDNLPSSRRELSSIISMRNEMNVLLNQLNR